MTRHLSRAATFLPGVAAGSWGWADLGHPAALKGLAVLAGAGLVCWPLIVLFLIFGLPAILLALIPPRPCRKWWRKRTPGLPERLLHRIVRSPVGRSGAKSAYIPGWLKKVVLAADRGRCVACGSTVKLNIDHIGPWSLGYLTTLANLMTLCWACNRAKSNAWLFRVRWWSAERRFWASRTCNPALAEPILRLQLRYRWSPARWLRAAWALGA